MELGCSHRWQRELPGGELSIGALFPGYATAGFSCEANYRFALIGRHQLTMDVLFFLPLVLAGFCFLRAWVSLLIV